MAAPAPDSAQRDTAAQWLIRRDRGLSAAEQTEFRTWLTADPRHTAALRRCEKTWGVLDRIPAEFAPAPAAAAPAPVLRPDFRRRTAFAAALGALAAAAAVAFVFVRERPAPREATPALFASAEAAVRSATLPDGSTVRLNTGAAIALRFSAGERAVDLVRGEAHFDVAKNPARPFVVQAGPLAVRAVGTAFNVRRAADRTEVIVTEGRVQLTTAAVGAAPLLGAGQRAVLPAVSAAAPAPALVVAQLAATEIAQALAWQEPLLRLGGATLAELAAEFERHTGRRIVLADPALAGLRIGGRFRADDIDGFANVLANTFEIEMERTADGTLVLRKKNPLSR